MYMPEPGQTPQVYAGGGAGVLAKAGADPHPGPLPEGEGAARDLLPLPWERVGVRVLRFAVFLGLV